jgi:hypothetical protein
LFYISAALKYTKSLITKSKKSASTEIVGQKNWHAAGKWGVGKVLKTIQCDACNQTAEETSIDL